MSRNRQPPRYDPALLRDLAGDRSYRRGATYLEQGRVTHLRIEGDRVSARVEGTDLYRVRLRGRGDALRADCDCPAWEDTGFCKHIVAVALAANAAGGGAGTPDPTADVAAWLRAQPPETLAALLVEHAAEDDALRIRLDTLAARALHPKQAESALRRAIDDQTRERALPAYRETRAWANAIADTLGAVEDLAAHDPAAGVAVAEHALARIEDAIGRIDDSNGYGLALLGDAVEVHQAAVAALRPDPIALAATLFRREMADGFDAFRGAADSYAEALGAAGRAEYRRLAQEAWDALPPRGKGEPEPERSCLLRILDRFHAADDDLPARVGLRRKDLGNAGSYWRLAQFCLDHGLAEQALEAARDGFFLHDRDSRLRDLLVTLLLASGREKEAAGHLWHAFERRPDHSLYQQLRRAEGEPARDRALAILEDRLARGRTNDRHGDAAHLLVRVLTEEGRFDRAWQLVAVTSFNARSLARASEATHPRQALEVYTAEIRELVELGSNGNYSAAVALLTRMAALRPAAEQAAHVAALREEYRRRRNFITLLDGGKLPGRG